jgi:hypothetical protein
METVFWPLYMGSQSDCVFVYIHIHTHIQDVSVGIQLNENEEIIVIPSTWAPNQIVNFTLLLHGNAELFPQVCMYACVYMYMFVYVYECLYP